MWCKLRVRTFDFEFRNCCLARRLFSGGMNHILSQLVFTVVQRRQCDACSIHGLARRFTKVNVVMASVWALYIQLFGEKPLEIDFWL